MLVAILDLIPLAGATIAAIIVGSIGFLHILTVGIILIVFFILYQQLENHVLQPLVYSRTVRLSPLVILISVLSRRPDRGRARCSRRDPGCGNDPGALALVARGTAQAREPPRRRSEITLLGYSLRPRSADSSGMRTLGAAGALFVLVLASTPEALGLPGNHSRIQRGHVGTLKAPAQRAAMLFRKHVVVPARPARPAGRRRLLSALELDIVARINAQRMSRGRRALRVSRGLTAAANYHTNQMGQLGFFEHESVTGAPFWRRIQRFYPAGRGYWSVGENIFWESPDTSAASAVREWMHSPPHRENILDREWRDVGISAAHYDSAPGAFGGRSVTIVTADFGVRR